MAFREIIARVAQKMNGSDDPVTETSPEYYTFADWMTDEQAEVLVAMELRQPTTADFLAPECGKSVEETERILKELADLGVIVHANVKGMDVYIMMVFAPGAYEMMIINKDLVEAHPEIAKGFDEWTLKHYESYMPNAPVGGGLMRVIPVERAVVDNPEVNKYELISTYIDRQKNHLCVTGCQCRRTRRLAGEGCGHLEDDMCIIMGAAADGIIAHGRGRKITANEAYDLLRKAEDNGLVHEVTNMDGVGKVFAICNCCTCSCFALRTSQYYNTPNLSRSNFVSEVDPEKCTACGQCVEVCPANALKLGQKLCTVKPIVHENTPLPDDHEWGPEMYNPDYRNSKANVVETGTSPCKTACPAHIAVQGYIKLASEGRYIEALELIKKENPFPAVCGRICPHNCESECTRGNMDEPIAIDEIKKYIADQELKSNYRFIPKKANNYGKKMAIIGGGPAGLSCAYYLAIDGYKVTVFEKQDKLGGMLTLGIPSFRLEKGVVNAEIGVLEEMGVEFKTGVEVGKDITIDQLRKDGYEAFYIAIGAQGARKLGVDGEDSKNVFYGVDFLREINLGNKKVKMDGKVVVIGGGNVAIDVARSAVRLRKVEGVEMYCLEQPDEMAALPEEIKEAEGEKVVFKNGWGPKRILSEDGKVTGVEFKKCTSVFDADGKFAPKYDENDTITVECDNVIVSIGQTMEWGGLLDGLKVETNKNGTAVADDFTYATSEPNVFVGGDIYTGPKYAIDAIAAGKEGAVSMHRSVWPGQSLTIGRNRRIFKALDKDNLDKDKIIEGFDNTSRQVPARLAKKEMTFHESLQTFTEEQMKKEAQRCLGCGATIVDQNRCLGCGLCVTKCKFDAIKLVKKYDSDGITFEELDDAVAERQKVRTQNIQIRIKNEAAEREPAKV